MIRLSFAAAASALVLVACASAPADSTAPLAAASTAEISPFELAMQSVETLVDGGNTQAAIDRLTQLTGDPSLSRDQVAEVLFRRGELRFSETGFDTMGAVEDFEEVIDDYSDTEWYTAAVPMLDSARGKATSLNTLLAQPETTRAQKFNILMELGQHDEAMDLMQAADLTPDNDTLLAMYQIGYLCEGDELTGRAYDVMEPDGTARELRFCDLGK
ncbi:MAG: tetratricopeptide repeat protein [Hyphomonas sp.]